MLNYVLSRLLTFIPTFIGVTLISFSFIRALPGDPIVVMAGERGLSDERYAELSKQFGFDQPIYVQFWDYLTGVLQGDLAHPSSPNVRCGTNSLPSFPPRWNCRSAL